MLSFAKFLAAGLAALVGLSLLGGCSAPSPSPSPAPGTPPGGAALNPTRQGTLTPYTPPPDPSPTGPGSPPAAVFTAVPVPSITPTPLTYVIKDKDDLGLIAYRFGVTIAALQAANPNVDPRAMRIGTVLIIPPSTRPTPGGASATQTNPSPTPVPIQLSGPDCWPSGDGGLWCFLLASNNQPGPLENISVKVRLGGAGSSEAAILERSASGLLDILPAGKSLPLAVFFPAPIPDPWRASAELTLSFALVEGSGRYLDPSLDGTAAAIAPDGLSAALSGQISLASGQAKTAWVAAAALDAQGRVVAVRRWENAAPLEAGKPASFEMDLFSLGGKITRVELLAEARP